MTDNSKILVALLAGAAAGVTLGILFAPDKGSNTRAKISDTTDDLKENMADIFNKGKDFMKSKFSESKEQFEDLASKMNKAASKAANSAS